MKGIYSSNVQKEQRIMHQFFFVKNEVSNGHDYGVSNC